MVLPKTAMKTHISPCRVLLALGACSLAFLQNSQALDEGSEFLEADADSSGFLTQTEFATTLSKNAKPTQILKKFTKADADDNKEVTLEEWLAYKNDEEEEDEVRGDILKFRILDTDDDGQLSFGEFKASRKSKEPLAKLRKRFLNADTGKDGQVNLEEWITYKNDGLPDETGVLRKFDLADLDGNGELTFEEFSTLFSPKKPQTKIKRKFDKEDENEDGVLSRVEWDQKLPPAPPQS